MNYITEAMNRAKLTNCQSDITFFQALEEVLTSIKPVIKENPKYLENNIIERIIYPNREIRFKIEWLDDKNNIQVNNGYRVQFNNALGPYKGGVRFHPSVNPDILKFLAFEQIFKNAITGLHIGGAKGGADFDPKGKSDKEIMKFCQAFMTAFYNSIGADIDILGGDIGVGEREVGYLFGQYKTLTNSYDSIITSKPIALGGSKGRASATGYGLVYFTQTLLEDMGETLKGKICTISGSGNVAIHAIEKLYDIGAIPVTCSDSKGTIHDPNGIDLALLKQIKLVNRASLEDYAEERKAATYVKREDYEGGSYVWSIPCFAAFPCATQNELGEESAQKLIDNEIKIIAEGANMPTTPQGIELFMKNKIIFAPAKAANAGGVAVSVLEMSQNNSLNYMSAAEVDEKLQGIMSKIYKDIKKTCDKYSLGLDLASGANILGFKRVANALIAQGV
ncbi:NADP-specific glutamate dehydrogenase [Sulfurovum sp. zt1-1]|uniref:Glutamate dehydrogenase n=1 Tax=Sulfurovum zhangzhouensis TaxID=3019067 RepID=A0ABT7R1C2_9BACT|nr:NADP-specific glutamate dehydrogenase [Sulfurovum zhangzhouensis]MDM5272604.1 NADP-specific glutamate dehydrogenase [Sulfurovum zhangzhouensis]